MTLQEIGSLGEAIGAAATVATLLYLALQIRATRLAAKRKSLDDIIDRVVQWLKQVVETPDHIRCWTAGHRSFAALSLEDQLRFHALMAEILAAFESNLEAAKFGDIKPDTANVIRELIAHLGRSEGVLEWWEASGRMAFAADFTQEVERIFETASAEDRDVPGPLPFRVPPLEAADQP